LSRSQTVDRPSSGGLFRLHLDVGLFDARQLGDDDEVVAFAEHVHLRVGLAAARACVQPTARPERVQSLLEIRQRVERIGKYCHHFLPIRHPPDGSRFEPNLRPFRAPGKPGPSGVPPPARRLMSPRRAEAESIADTATRPPNGRCPGLSFDTNTSSQGWSWFSMMAATWCSTLSIHGLPPADDAISCISAAIRSSRWAISAICRLRDADPNGRGRQRDHREAGALGHAVHSKLYARALAGQLDI